MDEMLLLRLQAQLHHGWCKKILKIVQKLTFLIWQRWSVPFVDLGPLMVSVAKFGILTSWLSRPKGFLVVSVLLNLLQFMATLGYMCHNELPLSSFANSRCWLCLWNGSISFLIFHFSCYVRFSQPYRLPFPRESCLS